MCTDAFQSRRVCLSAQTHRSVQPGAIDLSFLKHVTQIFLARLVLACTVASQQLAVIKFQFFNNIFYCKMQQIKTHLIKNHQSVNNNINVTFTLGAKDCQLKFSLSY